MRIAPLPLLAVLLAASIGAVGFGLQPAPEPAPPWDEILATTPAPVRPLETPVVWHEDLRQAMAIAQAEERAIFVTMRCERCEQCAWFDEAVLEGGPKLDPLLARFVLVRITDASRIDLRLFPVGGFQDLDLSWWGWFLSPKGQVYSVFGGRDEVADDTRISVDALAVTMRRVLAHHDDPRREAWNVDGAAPDLGGAAVTPRDLPGFDDWLDRSPAEARGQDCLHCHHVAEILRQPSIDQGSFDKRRDLEIWPLPENVGLELNRDHGLLVTDVYEGSAAHAAGIMSGDILGAAGDRRLFGQTDFRAALNRGPPGGGTIDVSWLHDGRPQHGQLEVADGWRSTVLSWRMSVSQGNIGARPGFWPLPLSVDERRQMEREDDVMGVKPFFGINENGPVWEAGLRPADVIIAVDDLSPNVAGRAFLVWFRLRHNPGDQVKLTVVDATGEVRQIVYEP